MRPVIAGFAFILALIGAAFHLKAEESQFRKQFIENYRTNNFYAQSDLVKKNKDIMAAEINSMITEAMLPEKSYQERKEELAKEKKKTEGLEKLQAVEKVPGNFIMALHGEEMAAKGLSPVIYPHWVHRAFFRCKVCHEDIFIMKRGANEISQVKIQEGKQCGVCHNGKISFNAGEEKNCERCHLLGRPESNPLMDLSYYSRDRFKEIASRVGAEWNPENLPVDKLGFINWVELDKSKAFSPLHSLNAGPDPEGIRETAILFETTSTFLNNVLFSHKTHSTWVKCSLCHPNVFKPEVGANKIKMVEMKDGKGCGLCHGRVAFSYADCLRCHNQPRENIPQGALIHRASAPAQ